MTGIEELSKMSVQERTKLKWYDNRLDEVATALEKQKGLPEGSLRALKFAENTGYKNGKISKSENDSTVVSPTGAKGIMQILDSTKKLQKGKFQHNHLDPVESLHAAADLLSYTLTNQYKGNVIAAFADYNHGPSAGKEVMAGKPISNKEAKMYVEKVTEWYKGNFGESIPKKQPATQQAPTTQPVTSNETFMEKTGRVLKGELASDVFDGKKRETSSPSVKP